VRQTGLHSSQSLGDQKSFRVLCCFERVWLALREFGLGFEEIVKQQGSWGENPNGLLNGFCSYRQRWSMCTIICTYLILPFWGGSRLQTPDSRGSLQKLLHDCWSIHTDEYMTSPNPNPTHQCTIIHPLESSYDSIVIHSFIHPQLSVTYYVGA
jgi:hypothetical protein